MLEMTLLGIPVWKYSLLIFGLIGGIGLSFVFDWMLRYWVLRVWQLHDRGKLRREGFRKQSIGLVLFSVALVFISSLTMSERWQVFLQRVCVVGIGYELTVIVSRVLEVLFREYWYKKAPDRDEKFHEGFVKSIWGIIQLVLWVIAVFIILDNIGVKINTILAGLGIGGIAVAFAAQSFLGDLFAFISIFLDKPFEVGDFLVIDADTKGTVEYIGLRSTRLRSLSGELLIVPNRELTSLRLHNYRHMERRRVVIRFGVVYETSHEKLKTIPWLVKEIVEAQPQATFDRCHFDALGDYSLDFECVYYVESSDFLVHMDVKQTILYRMMEVFAEKGIEFAYPTHVVYTHSVKK
ncbi:MAG: mechanosensitive ion channel family protein [Brevinematales bacterium]|nr:mechanosensitive ion channel family protein [Brevinematales bacterium]